MISKSPIVIFKEIYPSKVIDNDVAITLLGEGYTNSNYLINYQENKFVLRVTGENTNFLGINREDEFRVLTKLSSYQIAPTIIGFQKNGNMLSHYIEGNKLLLKDFRDKKTLIRIINTILTFHKLEINAITKFSPFDSIRNYFLEIVKLKGHLPLEINYALETSAKIEKKCSEFPQSLGITHNDLVRVNFLDDGKIRILDWEFSGWGNIMFDLAALSVENGFFPELDQVLVSEYFKNVTTEKTILLNLYKPIWILREAMWALLQNSIEEKPFFVNFANKRIQKYLEILNNLDI